MKRNKILNRLLVLSLLGVWGSIAWQFVQAGKDEESGLEADRVSLGGPEKTPDSVAFERALRDPFRYYPVKAEKRPAPPRMIEPTLIPPPLKLTGIVSDGHRKLVVIEHPSGAVEFIGEGDTTQGLRITKIFDDRVTYTFMKSTREWRISASAAQPDYLTNQ